MNYVTIVDMGDAPVCVCVCVYGSRLGMLLVGVGGNNGTTVMGGVIANSKQMRWRTKEGEHSANWYGSLLQCGVVKLGDDAEGNEIHVPFCDLLPTVDPNEEVVVGGWDINSTNMADAMERAQVLDFDLQQKLRPFMESVVPMKGIYDPEFIAANQATRANHVLDANTMSKMDMVERIRSDIRDFKAQQDCDKVIVLWTANTERFSKIIPGVNCTAETLMNAVAEGHPEVSPSTMYAIACILENVPFINGSPQNTFVPGAIDLAEKHGSFIAGDDFKSGQTKMKSVLMDFLVGAGIKPKSIVSYNHLGNNDGYNLSEQKTFRSKEISKSNVVDDMVHNNTVLYPPKDQDAEAMTAHDGAEANGNGTTANGKATANGNGNSATHGKDTATNRTAENIDHCVVIKYIPYVGDSKRALDEYTSEIFMNGRNTIVMHNTCEDSLLSAPIIVDMVLLMELVTRISIKKTGRDSAFRKLHPVASLLSYMAKAPLVRQEQPLINALSRQRAMIENFLKACIGLPPDNNIMMEYK